MRRQQIPPRHTKKAGTEPRTERKAQKAQNQKKEQKSQIKIELPHRNNEMRKYKIPMTVLCGDCCN